MLIIGMDVHLSDTMLLWLDTETGETSEPYAHPTSELAEHVAGLPGMAKVAVMETGSQSAFLARQLGTLGCEVHVVDAFKTRRWFEGMYGLKKTDKIDARGLALAWADGGLRRAEVWVANAEQQALREWTRARETFVATGARYRGQIRQLLARENRRCPFADLLGVRAQAWLDDVAPSLPAASQQVLAIYRRQIAQLAEEVKALNAAIAAATAGDEDAQLLQTMPGIGEPMAAAIKAEIGTFHRFASANQLRGYTGLVPRVVQSGERLRYGPLTRAGNPRLRRLMILAAQHFVQSRAGRESALYRWYLAQVFRHGRNPAKVALARRLTTILFAMLRDRTAFVLDNSPVPKAA
jgi:transposase